MPVREGARGAAGHRATTRPRGTVSSNALLGALLVSRLLGTDRFLTRYCASDITARQARRGREGAEFPRETACPAPMPVCRADCERRLGVVLQRDSPLRAGTGVTATRRRDTRKGRRCTRLVRVVQRPVVRHRLSLHSMRLTLRLTCEGCGSLGQRGLRQVQPLVVRPFPFSDTSTAAAPLAYATTTYGMASVSASS